MKFRYAGAIPIILLAGCSASHTMNQTDMLLAPQSLNQPHAVAQAIATMPLGALVEYRIPSAKSGPYFIAPAGDGNVWFTETSTNKIGRVTPSGAVTEFSVSGTTSPLDIRTGPDGHPWFGAFSPDVIGSVAYDGSVQLYPIPTAGGHPEQLVGDVIRNAVWFAERHGHTVGEFLLATHTFVEFGVPTPPGGIPPQPSAIALDGSGNVWFSDFANDQIDEMSGTGTMMQQLTLPGGTIGNGALGAWRMTLGSDGDLWLVETTGGAYSHGGVARINPSTDSITTLTSPSSKTHCQFDYDVVKDSTGVWITEPGNGNLCLPLALPAIAHISNSTGQFKEYTTVPSALGGIEPVGITVGSDNNLWFVDISNNAIAKVVLSLLP